MSVPTPKRRIRTLLAATALTAVLATGCTAGDWRYESPPAAGTQADAGPVKARNLVLVTDGSQATLLGTLSTFEAVSLQGAVVTPEDADGGRGQSLTVAITADIPRDGTLKLDASNTTLEGAPLLPGRLAEVSLQFDGGLGMTLDVPVFSTEHEDFANALEA